MMMAESVTPSASSPGGAPTDDLLAGLAAAHVATEDPLLDCLVFLTRYHGRARSAEVLIAGLPLHMGRLSAQLFLRAAGRVGLRARVVKRELRRISEQVLPTVVALRDNNACVLISVGEDGSASVMHPGAGGGVDKVSLADLEKDYIGYCIMVRPEFDLHNRSEWAEMRRPYSWFWGTISANWWIYVQVGLAAVLVNLFALALPLYNMIIYNKVVPNNAIDSLWVLSIGAVSVLVFDFIIRSLRAYFLDVAGKKADVMLACRLFDQVLDMRMNARPASTGAFASTLREFETLRDFFTSVTLGTLVDLPFIFVFIFVIWLISGPIALLLAVAVPIILAYALLIQIPLNLMVRRNQREAQEKHGVLIEALTGLEAIKSIGAEGRMRHLWEGFVGLSAQSSQKSRTLAMSAINFAGFLQQAVTVAVMVYGVYLMGDGEMTMGGLVACSMLGGRAIAPVSQLAQLLTRLSQSMAALKALDAVMRAPIERPADKTFLHRPEIEGAVQFQDVKFSYPSRDREVLKGVSFAIKPGEHVAIIGRVGSGKSTVAKLILGLYEPGEGAVLIDGTDIRQIDPVDLRRNIGYVSQEPFLLRGTVRENITAAAPHADDEAILWAGRLSGIDDFLRQDPSGYDLPVGEQGQGLSGGQRQLVTIARAFVRNPRLILLDEPTSAMDSKSEETLVQRLKPHIAGRTVVLITHRGSLLNLVNRVIVFDSGRIVADGPRAVVLEALAAGRIAAAKT